jgi:hypothetical protein
MRSDSGARYTDTAHTRYQSPIGCQERKIPVFHAWIDPSGQQVYLKMGIGILSKPLAGPFPSSPITEPSSVLLTSPPRVPASLLSPSWVTPTCRFSLTIRFTVPTFTDHACYKVMPPFCRMPLSQLLRYPDSLSALQVLRTF